ncbi:MAG: hypothetical protein E5Y12_15455 [Mesorhizobium sp.]|nr:MAG: hypothetical protein E5Y12_15455 [Mesorhizobium sp.]
MRDIFCGGAAGETADLPHDLSTNCSWPSKLTSGRRWLKSKSSVPSHPPLSCRTSPPQGGRLAMVPVFANRQPNMKKAAPVS